MICGDVDRISGRNCRAFSLAKLVQGGGCGEGECFVENKTRTREALSPRLDAQIASNRWQAPVNIAGEALLSYEPHFSDVDPSTPENAIVSPYASFALFPVFLMFTAFLSAPSLRRPKSPVYLNQIPHHGDKLAAGFVRLAFATCGQAQARFYTPFHS